MSLLDFSRSVECVLFFLRKGGIFIAPPPEKALYSECKGSVFDINWFALAAHKRHFACGIIFDVFFSSILQGAKNIMWKRSKKNNLSYFLKETKSKFLPNKSDLVYTKQWLTTNKSIYCTVYCGVQRCWRLKNFCYFFAILQETLKIHDIELHTAK